MEPACPRVRTSNKRLTKRLLYCLVECRHAATKGLAVPNAAGKSRQVFLIP